MDKATAGKTRVAYARIYVLVRAGVEMLKRVIIIDSFGIDSSQDVEYEWVPPQCRKCSSFGHDCEANTIPVQKTNEFISHKNLKQARVEKKYEWKQQQPKT